MCLENGLVIGLQYLNGLCTETELDTHCMAIDRDFGAWCDTISIFGGEVVFDLVGFGSWSAVKYGALRWVYGEEYLPEW